MDNVDFLEAQGDVGFNEYHLESTPDDSYLSSPVESEPSIGAEALCYLDSVPSGSSSPEFQWNSFFEKPKTDVLFDENKQPVHQYFIDPRIETAARYENNEWVFYRRNHLKVTASFEVDMTPKFFLGSSGTLLPIEGMTMSIFGVSDFRGNFESVELFQTNAKREAKAAPAPQFIVPNKKICFSHLHFIRSTMNNKKKGTGEQEHFFLVVCVDVNSGNESVRICAYCSSGFVLRGGSPQSKKNSAGSDQNSGDGSSQHSTDSSKDIEVPSKRRREEREKDGDHTPKMYSPVRADINTSGVAVSPNTPTNTPVVNTSITTPTAATANISTPNTVTPTTTTVAATTATATATATTATPNTTASTCVPAVAVYSVHGRLGVNTDRPSEALHVNGNALITGTLYHPSDRRVKTDIRLLDTKKQLATIRQLKLYQYRLKNGSLCLPGTSSVQHGVIAQEVARIMPQAVIRTVGRRDENGDLSELLAVDKDAIFMENVGATVELSKQFDDLSSKLETLDSKVDVLRPKSKESTSISLGKTVKLSITALTKTKKITVLCLCSLSLIFMIVAFLTNVL